MVRHTRQQLLVLLVLLVIYALLAFITYAFVPLEQLTMGMATQLPPPTMAPWVMGLANAAIVLVVYGLLGLAGYWFATRVGMPGMFREGAGWRAWAGIPLVIGLIGGIVLIVGDRIFAGLGGYGGFPHPAFPFSLIASATAAIGEEILLRGFVMGLWAFLLNLILRRWKGNSGHTGTTTALWIANVIAALAFGAAHLPTVMLLYGVSSIAELSPWVLAEVFVLNGVIGLIAGQQNMRTGLVAAMGVHFWTDIVWHVAWPLLGI